MCHASSIGLLLAVGFACDARWGSISGSDGLLLLAAQCRCLCDWLEQLVTWQGGVWMNAACRSGATVSGDLHAGGAFAC